MANNQNVKVCTVTVTGKVFQAPELREGNNGNKFATFKVVKNNGKDRDGNWLPSAFFSVLLPKHVATKKDSGEPSWLVNKLVKDSFVSLTGKLEVGAYTDNTKQPVPSLSLVVNSFDDVVLCGSGGGSSSTPGDAAEDGEAEVPF